jgi:hypothetical protein
MANKVNINIKSGGLGRPLQSTDHVSGLAWYTTATLPTGYTNSNRIKQVFSVSEAADLGITNTHLGETRATGTTTITATGATNETLIIKVAEWDDTVTIYKFTQDGTYTTPSAIASVINTNINDTTAIHGYTSTVSTSALTISAPAGTGTGGNSFTFSNIYSGALSATTSAFANGAYSNMDLLYYNVQEYFRNQPQGNLFVGIFSSTTDYSEVTTMQNLAEGAIVQCGVYTQSNFTTTAVGYLQTVADLNYTNNKPLEIIFGANFVGSASTDLINLHSNCSAKNVSVCLGQDGANKGYALYNATNRTKSINCVGTILGLTSKAAVNQSIANPGNFNVANGEFETPALANGYNLKSLSDGLIDAIDDKGYVFVKKIANIAGSYVNNPYTAVITTSNFFLMPYNRVMAKAKKTLRSYLVPALASILKVSADGTLSNDTIGYFETLAKRGLEFMERNGEISAYSVTIDPLQNVLSTSELVIGVDIVPTGLANTITVNVGFALQTST